MSKDNIFKYFFGVPPPPPSIVLESADIRHGENCDCCTPIKVCNKLDEQRQQQYREAHKGRFKGERARRAKRTSISDSKTDSQSQAVSAAQSEAAASVTEAPEPHKLDPKYSEAFD